MGEALLVRRGGDMNEYSVIYDKSYAASPIVINNLDFGNFTYFVVCVAEEEYYFNGEYTVSQSNCWFLVEDGIVALQSSNFPLEITAGGTSITVSDKNNYDVAGAICLAIQHG